MLAGILSALGVVFLSAGCTISPSQTLTVKGSISSTAASAVLLEGFPTSLKISIYDFYVSKNSDCSDPTIVIDYGSVPLVKELAQGPVLFSGKPDAGEYKCLILSISDQLKFKPAFTNTSDTGADVCEEGVEYTYDLYTQDTASSGVWRDMNGNEIAANGSAASPVDDRVTLFASTATLDAVEALDLANGQVIALADPIVVPGELVLFFDYNDAFASVDSVCSIQGGRGIGYR